MNLLVSPAEMRAAERSAIERGRSEPDLMRAAAEEIAQWLVEHIAGVRQSRAVTHTAQLRAVALVGPGNNGGDGLVTLALLSSLGWRVSAVMLGREALRQLPVDPALLANIEYVGTEELDSADVIIDAVYGIGSRTVLPAAVADAFHVAHTVRARCRTPLIAVDVPSGIDAETGAASDDAFRADATLCLGLPKLGLVHEPAASHVGELFVLDIGIAEPALADTTGRPRLLSRSVVQPLLPARRASVHKSDAGTLLVVAGAPTYYGAPRLAGAAAMRAGAGLVALAAPESIVPTIATAVSELVMLPLAAHDSADSIATISAFASARASTLRAAVIGPGLGAGPDVDALLEALLGTASAPEAIDHLAQVSHVIDADGLNWISRRGAWPEKLRSGAAVLTPHAGELARLLDIDIADILDAPWDAALRAAASSGQIVVLKLGYACIASPRGEIWLAPRATPELATAGTGDVLAGLIGGLLAQGIEPWDAARLAVYIGSQAGRLARDRIGTLSVIASDIIDTVPTVLRSVSDPNWNESE